MTAKFKKLFAFIGPAYLVSVGYMDPGNWATDIAAGSQFGYTLLWVILLSNLAAVLVQSLSARLGLVTGKDLAQFSRAYYPAPVNFILWIFAEVAIAATDLAEVLGVTIGLNLLFGLNLLTGLVLTLFDTFLVMFLLRKGMRTFESVIIAMIGVIGVSFLIQLWMSKPVLTEIVSGLVPSLPGPEAVYLAAGIIGATVMPHNLYLHSSLVQTRKFEPTPAGIMQAIRFNLIDTVTALNLALFVNAAILILAASAFYHAGYTGIRDITEAHKLLQPILGSALAPMLFAVALIISGQSSTLTGTLSGQIIMEGYLNLRISPVARRMITRSLAVIPAFLVIWISGPAKVGSLLVFSQVVLSFQLGFALIPLVHWVSSTRIMGMFQVKRLIRLAAWATVAVIVGLNLTLFVGSLRDTLERSTHPLVTYLLVIPLSVAIILLLLYILFEPVISSRLIPALSPTHHFDDDFELGTPEPFRRIAITIDFTKADQSTLKYALSQGGKEADYFLIHIVESAGARLMNAEITDKESSEDEGFIGKYAQHLLDMGYRAEAIIDYGVAGSMIPDVVGHIDADLLVMSSHRKGFIHRLFKGTTIRKVQQRVNIPMMILK